MFPTDSIEELNRIYERNGSITYAGVWSSLLTRSAEESANFARNYFDIFNDVAGIGWHLAIYAKHNFEEDNTTQRWTANPALHAQAEAIRKVLIDSGVSVPERCIVFFDPHTANESGEFRPASADYSDHDRCVIVPLNFNEIGNKELYRTAFEKTHKGVMKVLNAKFLDPYARIPPDQMPDVLLRLQSELKSAGMRSILATFSRSIYAALLGAIVGIPIK